MPISIRRVKVSDMIQMQQTNLHCLPENYHLWYWLYHYLMGPQAAHVAINTKGELVGYVLGKMDDDGRNKRNPEPPHGHITSVAIYNGYRKLGLATKLLSLTHNSLHDVFQAKYVCLNVRETNRGGHILYQNTMGYKFEKNEVNYYADDENGWLMRYTFPEEENPESDKKKDEGPARNTRKKGRGRR